MKYNKGHIMFHSSYIQSDWRLKQARCPLVFRANNFRELW